MGFVVVRWRCIRLLSLQQDLKNEAESYMLREFSLMKWQEKAAKLAYEDSNTKMIEMQANLSSLEENLNTQRCICLLHYVCVSIQSSHFCIARSASKSCNLNSHAELLHFSKS